MLTGIRRFLNRNYEPSEKMQAIEKKSCLGGGLRLVDLFS